VVDVPDAAPSRAPRISPRRLAIVLGVWVAVAGGAILLALALDSPVGEGARDEAQPAVAGPVAMPAPESPSQGDLPPLALVLDRPSPGAGELPPQERIARLRERAAGGSPRQLVELGAALALLGEAQEAERAYRQALARAPGDLAARAGLAMVEGARGGAGLARGAAALDRLAAEHPSSQLVAFNQGWLAIYRRRAEEARAAWNRTVALGADTRLGRTAGSLLQALDGEQPGP
jgi:cytochrome c-type biogenesis protein CcmH/NrfG